MHINDLRGSFFGGDEIDSLNDSWMFILWRSDANPYRTDSASSRFPIAVLPASVYWFDDNGVNLTLQAIAAEVTNNFNKLSVDGIKIRNLQSLGRGTVP